MRILAFSDLHRDEAAARNLVGRAHDVDVLLGAGDLATMRAGLQPMVDILAESSVPVILVPGNGESDGELAAASASYAHVHSLHGAGSRIGSCEFYGVGGGIPVTPFGSWSFDLHEDEAAALLRDCPEEAVLVSHSPPFGHCDQDGSGRKLGSRAVLDAIRQRRPSLVICGHIHASWGQESRIGSTRVVNAGPGGRLLEL